MKKSNPEELLAHGLHFGHRTQKVHPKSKKFIYKIEDGVSIIDLFKTATELDKALEYIYNLGRENKKILFIATKKQAKSLVKDICINNDIFYMVHKWQGGFATNFDELSKNIKKLNTMKKDKEEGAWNIFPKHERVKLDKDLAKLTKIYEGVEKMEKLPDAFFIIDIKKENNACIEAKKMNIKTVAIADTNTNPEIIDFPIPANDDAISSIKYLTELITETYVEGRKKAEVKKPDEKKVEEKAN